MTERARDHGEADAATTAPPWKRVARALARPPVALAALTLLLAVCYASLFRGEPNGDDLTFHLAEIRRLADCFRAWDFDLWNISANAGYASAYYYQVIPLAVPAALAALTHTDVLFWFQLCIFLPLVLVPLAAYRGMRLLHATPWASVSAGAAVAFAISSSKWGHGADGTFTVGLYTQTWAFAAFPLALGYGVRWALHGASLGAAIAWGAFVGMCHPFAGVALGVALVAGLGADGLVRAVAAVLGRRAPRAPRWWAALQVRSRPHEERRTSPGRFGPQFGRLTVLGLALLIASAATWLPVLVDYDGFGGFPHRVAGEDGPGFLKLMRWYARGGILDSRKLQALTWSLPVVLVFARARYLRWLWGAAFAYAFLLSIGPHLKTQDDLLPAVRFLGSLQITLALGIGAGLLAVGAWLHQVLAPLGAGLARGAVAALAAGMIASVVGWGAWVQGHRIHVAGENRRTHRDEMAQVIEALRSAPPGRKQALAGATNHWWNLLPFVYAERPALLQMGGGGLQSSPNYDFLWMDRDPMRNAWLFDAPYIVFERAKAKSMPEGPMVVRTKRYEVRRLPAPGLVSPVQVTGTLPPGRKAAHRAALTWLTSGKARRDELLAYDGHGGAGPAPSAVVRSTERRYSSGDSPDLVAEVDVTTPSTLVFRESWHPRWTGLIDGREVPVRRLTPDFPALDVPAGVHTIALRFDRPWWALAAWLLWPVMIALGWAVSRRTRASPSPDNAP
ncbi:MAG: hypothetical protein R3B48_16440 [Kofleriaceae bacterium]